VGSIHGFRCRECRTEVLASPALSDLREHRAWTPPVLCCGRALQPLDCDQIPPTMLALRRFAACPTCRQRVRLIVHPAGPLICMICHRELQLEKEVPDGTGVSREAPVQGIVS